MLSFELLMNYTADNVRKLQSEITALVSLLSPEQREIWINNLKDNCKKMKIDPITGRKLGTFITDDQAAEAADLSL